MRMKPLLAAQEIYGEYYSGLRVVLYFNLVTASPPLFSCTPTAPCLPLTISTSLFFEVGKN